MKSVFVLLILVLLTVFTSSSIAQTDWTKYEGNPVLEPGPSGTWNDYSLFPFCVLFDGNTYHMWYGGHDGTNVRIGYATSADGITWTPYAGNPVMDVGQTGSWENDGVLSPYVLFDGSTYHMWYEGGDGTYSRIGYATSTDGISWTKYTGNPVMDKGSTGSWMSNAVGNPCILYDGNTYHMWFYGWSASDTGRIGYATSSNGITWTQYEGNPVLTPDAGEWDLQRVEAPDVFFDGKVYHMWYSGGNTTSWWRWRLGYATSSDGITWTKNAGNPILPLGSWDSRWAGFSRVLLDTVTSQYKMWYGGGSGDWHAKIGYATAPLNLYVPGDYATIQGAIDAAHDGDVILVDAGTYYENINFKGKAITVASHFYMDGDTSHISETIIDGSQPANPDSGSVVYFVSGEDTTSVLIGFTITNGTGTKGQYKLQGLTYDFRGGGGIACWNSGGRLVRNRIINNTITGDNDVMGGGFGAGDIGSNAWVILKENLIYNNRINGVDFAAGGGVSLSCNARLEDNTISYNSSTATEFEANGGGIKITTESVSQPRTIIIKGNRIKHNLAEGKKYLNHHSAKGGGIVNHYCKVIILNNEICYNQLESIGSGEAYGAGINMNEANSGSLISGNLISDNTIAEDISGGGGGISLRLCNVSVPITNNIIAGNSGLNGGGIYLYNSESEIINNTIVENIGLTSGGGLLSAAANPVVINTILWENESTSGSQLSGNFLVRYSDVQGGMVGEGNKDVDPLFVAGDSLYHLMDTGDTSMCLNTGIASIEINTTTYQAPLTDYDGNPRPQPPGTPHDMGAWESKVVNALENIKGSKIPSTFTLKQNYPNPFNPLTTIEFSIPQAEFVSLKIYNLLGQQIVTLVSEKLRAGNYKYTWHASGFATGIYYYQLTAGGFYDLKKMILLR